MRIFSSPAFYNEYLRIIKHNSYKDFPTYLIDHFFKCDITEVQEGFKLSGSSKLPLIKKRLKGKGGYRIYFYVFIIQDSIFLIYLHPKRGRYGRDNITKAELHNFHEELLKCYQNNDYYELTLTGTSDQIKFDHSSHGF